MLNLYLESHGQFPQIQDSFQEEFVNIQKEIAINSEISIESRVKTNLFPFEILSENSIPYLIKTTAVNRSSKHLPLLPLFCSRIIYIFALPDDFEYEEIFKKAEKFWGSIKSVKIIKEGQTKTGKYSLLVYFQEEKAAEAFFHEFNCWTLNERDELLYILFLNKIFYFCQPLSLQKILDFQNLEDALQMPTCPLCIERFDGSVTGIYFESIAKLFIYERKDRWLHVLRFCKVCRLLKDPLEKPSCLICSEKDDLWICVICGNIGCGRYKTGHASKHFQETRHAFALELKTQRVWDYINDAYIHRLVRNQEYLITDLPDANDDDKTKNNDKNIEEKISKIMMQYNYLMGSQLEEQRKFFEDKLQNEMIRMKNDPQMMELERMTAQTEKEKRDIQSEVNFLEVENQKTKKKIKILAEKIMKIQQEMEESQLLNKMLKENLSKIEESKDFEEDEEALKEKQKIDQLTGKLALLYKKLEFEDK